MKIRRIDGTKLIIFFTVILFLASSMYLFSVSSGFEKSAGAADWWAVDFQDAKGNGLNFTIDNHGTENSFHWEILLDNQKAQEGSLNIPAGGAKSFMPSLPETSGKKITVSVTLGSDANNTKEIYKNLAN